ncbi:MAG: GNAT family N-acetyltransferase [Chloroflexota bacterium]
MTSLVGLTLRPATEADLPACENVWRSGLNDYLIPLGQVEIPAENPTLRQLHAHVLATDPARFWVGTRTDESSGDEEVVAFAAATLRNTAWFLSMLFVLPREQRSGVGRALLEAVLPPPGQARTLAVTTDAAQPASNGLYAAHGMTPRLPMFNLVGRPIRQDPLPSLPPGIVAVPFDASTPAERDRPFEGELATLDLEVLGFAHPEDHSYLRQAGRIGLAYRSPSSELVGYGYTSEVGRIGPVAALEPALLAPIVAHLLDAVLPRGASALWVPGSAAPTLEMLVRSGLRIEGFPALLCWTEPATDFSRYLPTSPGLI